MLKHMRTTVILPDHLIAEAKRYAAQHRRTLTSVIEESLRITLARVKASATSKATTKLPTVKGGLRPGVDLDNSAALADLLDGFD